MKKPDPAGGTIFHTICVGEKEKQRSYTFAQSLDVWYLYTHAPDIRILQSLTCNYLGAATISAIVNRYIRSYKIPEEEENAIKNAMDCYVYDINTAHEEATRALRHLIKKLDNVDCKILAKRLKKTCQDKVVTFSPTSGVPDEKPMMSHQDSSSSDERTHSTD